MTGGYTLYPYIPRTERGVQSRRARATNERLEFEGSKDRGEGDETKKATYADFGIFLHIAGLHVYRIKSHRANRFRN